MYNRWDEFRSSDSKHGASDSDPMRWADCRSRFISLHRRVKSGKLTDGPYFERKLEVLNPQRLALKIGAFSFRSSCFSRSEDSDKSEEARAIPPVPMCWGFIGAGRHVVFLTAGAFGNYPQVLIQSNIS